MDLERFHRRALHHRRRLRAFLQKLGEVVPEDFQSLVDETDAAVWQAIDCTTCAHCCKAMTPTYRADDLRRIARHFRMSVPDFKTKWLTQNEENGDWVNRETPCSFLRPDDRCGIYEIRPADCAGFPHHNKKPFDEWSDTFIGNVDKCPATFELVLRLKKAVEAGWDFPET